MKSRLLRLAAIPVIAALLPVVLSLAPTAGYADPTDGPWTVPSAPVPSGPGPDREPIVRPRGTVAFEKGSSCPPKHPKIVLSRPADHDITVVVETIDGSATAPDDYVAIQPGKVLIPAKTVEVEIPITIVADDVKESDEYFKIRISSPSEGSIGEETAAVDVKDGKDPTPCK